MAGLGKGLGNLIPGSDSDEISSGNGEIKEVIKEVVKEVKVNEPLIVKIREIDPNKNQPRKDFQEDALKELADSIKQYGVVQPLVLHKKGKRYEIIAGERRWRAAKLAGLKEVPAIVKEYSDTEIMEVALIENIQREDLNPIEEAMAYKNLSEEYNLTQEEISKKVSKSRASVANMIRLLKLPDAILEKIAEGSISTGHAKVLLSLESEEIQLAATEKIINDGLNVRQTETLIKKLQKPEKVKPEFDHVLEYEQIRERLCERLGTKVEIKRKKDNKGKIEIEYYSFEELEGILAAMGTFRDSE